MDSAGAVGRVENFNAESPASEQFLPHATGTDVPTIVNPAADDGMGRLREDLRRLAQEVAAIDRRDASQHGGLKGEIAHLVRRIARLEALPKARPAR